MTTPALRGGAVLAAAVLVSGAIVLGVAPLFALLPQGGSPLAQALFVTGATALLYGLLAGAALLGLRLGGEVGVSLGSEPARWGAIGFAVGMSGLLAAVLYARLAGTAQAGAGAAGTVATLLLGTLVIPFQAAAEELFFRGWLQRALRRAWGPAPALAAAALAFGLLHLLGGERSGLSLANIVLAGLLFGLLAERSGGLAAPIGAHAAWNWAEQLLLGLDPNPGTGPFGALFDLDLRGAPWWGGSAEGLNASLAVTVVLAALIVPLAATVPLSRSPARG